MKLLKDMANRNILKGEFRDSSYIRNSPMALDVSSQGRIIEKPTVVDGEVEVKLITILGLSFGI